MTAPRQLDLLVRYLDVTLVLAAAPVFVLGELPVMGYLVAAVAWIATRYGVAVAQRRAMAAGNPGRQAATLLASMMVRVLAIVAAILIARFAGSNDDGIAAAAVALAAFTVQLLVTISLRSYAPRPGGSS
jgi:hypothetical protein